MNNITTQKTFLNKKKKLMKTSPSKDVYTTRELYFTATQVMYIEETV